MSLIEYLPAFCFFCAGIALWKGHFQFVKEYYDEKNILRRNISIQLEEIDDVERLKLISKLIGKKIW